MRKMTVLCSSLVLALCAAKAQGRIRPVAAVADTGIGMSSEVMVRIFDKFYRAREARDIEAQGLGLGLALVREFVDAHGGRVEVRSEVGRGSTFCVYLPRDGQGVEGEDGFHRA